MNKKIKTINDYVLTEKDFYPPSDDRTLKTYVEEMYNDEFYEYAEYVFDLYEEEGYYEN